jgi:hypothetical protein
VTINAPVVVDVEVAVLVIVAVEAEINPAPVINPSPAPVVTILVAVNIPPTLTLPPIPTPPVTTNAPVVVENEVAVPLTVTVVAVMILAVSITDPISVAPVMDPPEPVVTILPPRYKSPPIPTPPATTNAPVVVLVDEAVLPIVAVPVIVAVVLEIKLAPVMDPPDPVVAMKPPTNKLPPIPAPPRTCNAPVLVEVAEVRLDMINVVVVPVEDAALPPPVNSTPF